MNNDHRTGRAPPAPLSRNSTSLSGQSTLSNSLPPNLPQQTASYESEGPRPPSLSPSSLNLSHSHPGSGHSSEAHHPQQSHPHPPHLYRQGRAPRPQEGAFVTGRPLVAEPQPLDLGQLPGYGFFPGGPLVVGAPGTLSTGGFYGPQGTFYEPQGELESLLQSQQPPNQDFVSPTPVPPRSQSIASAQRTGSFSAGAPGGGGSESTATSAFASSSVSMSSSRTQGASSITTRGQKRKAGSTSAERRPSTAASASAASPIAPDQKRASISRPSLGATDLPSSRMVKGQRPSQAEHDSEADDDDEEDEEEQKQQQMTATEQTDTKPVVARQRQSEASNTRRIAEVASHLTTVLPAGKVFPIQIGSELFRLSGASISSDAPSYFSHYFGEQLIQTGGRASQVKTLYIDRDPETFKDIALHLQGYYVKPRDEEHFVRLFADTQFYSLPRLTQQLFKSEIFIQVGNRHFQIPRDIFSSPGDSPNFFSLGFAHFFSTPSEVFPGLDRQTLLRPPSILPPSVANRSGDVFADLLRILQGYDVKIRDAGHRAELLRDARYFHLKGVEQKLIPSEISHNVLRGRSEIVLRLEDIRQSGVSFLPEAQSQLQPRKSSSESKSNSPVSASEAPPTFPVGWITYQRPYVDDTAHDLILEISSSEATRLDVASMRASFSGQVKARIASLFSVVANKLNLPAMLPLGLMLMQSGGGIAAQPASPANSGLSGDKVRIRIDRDAFVTLDSDVVEWDDDSDDDSDNNSSDENMTDESIRTALPKVRRWKRERQLNKEMEWLVQRGQWRLRIEGAEDSGAPSRVEVVLCAIKLEGYTREMHRNKARGFLV